MAATKEAHHFYPVLFYMRFAEPYYSLSFATLVLLDAVAYGKNIDLVAIIKNGSSKCGRKLGQ